MQKYLCGIYMHDFHNLFIIHSLPISRYMRFSRLIKPWTDAVTSIILKYYIFCSFISLLHWFPFQKKKVSKYTI